MSQIGIVVRGFGFGVLLAIAIGRNLETTYDERIREIKRVRSFYTNVEFYDIGKNR
jgi:hypothetical protein